MAAMSVFAHIKAELIGSGKGASVGAAGSAASLLHDQATPQPNPMKYRKLHQNLEDGSSINSAIVRKSADVNSQVFLIL